MKKFYLVLCVTLGAIHLVLAQGFQLGWHLTGGGPSVDFIHEIMQDKSGNIIITGAFSGTVDFDPGPGVFNLSIDLQHTHSDAFVAKYTAAGTFLWAKKFAAAQNAPDHGLQLAIDDTNNIYMVGEYQGDIQFFPGGTWYNWGNAPGKPRLFMTKLDSTGNLKWGFGWQNTGLNSFMTVRPSATFANSTSETFFLGTDGYLYLGGVFSGKMDFDPSLNSIKLDSTVSSNSKCPFFMKLDLLGNIVAQKSLTSTNSTPIFEFNHFTIDPSGNLWIACEIPQGVYSLDAIAINQGLATQFEGTLLKMDTSFGYLWHYTNHSINYKYLIFRNGTMKALLSYRITSNPVDFDPGPNVVVPPFFGGEDAAILTYDTLGNYVSFLAFGGPGQDWPGFFEFSNDGDLIIAGKFSGTIDVDPGPSTSSLQSLGSFDVFVSRYDSVGAYISSMSFGSINFDVLFDFLLVGNNDVLLAGEYRDSMDIDPDTTTLMAGFNGSRDLFLLSYTSCSKTYTTYADTACGSYALPGSGLVVTQSGTYLDTLSGKWGCDSILTIQLTMLPDLNPTVSQNIDGLLASTTDSTATFAWLDCQTGQLVPGSTSNPWMPPYNGTFAAVTYSQGCQDTSACYSINNVGLDESGQVVVQLYPNPTSGLVYVRSNDEIMSIRVINLIGQELFQVSKEAVSIDLSDYPEGIYLIMVETQAGFRVERVVNAGKM
jgi:hypothetical protein